MGGMRGGGDDFLFCRVVVSPRHLRQFDNQSVSLYFYNFLFLSDTYPRRSLRNCSF